MISAVVRGTEQKLTISLCLLDNDTFAEDHDTIHSYHDTNHDTKRVPLTNKQKDIVNFCSVPRTSREFWKEPVLSIIQKI